MLVEHRGNSEKIKGIKQVGLNLEQGQLTDGHIFYKNKHKKCTHGATG